MFEFIGNNDEEICERNLLLKCDGCYLVDIRVLTSFLHAAYETCPCSCNH